MSIVLKVDNYSFVYPNESMSLLEIIEDHGIDVEYQCRQGFCGSCRLKLIEGEVSYFEEPVAFIPENYILPCCCRTKKDIVIERGKKEEENIIT